MNRRSARESGTVGVRNTRFPLSSGHKSSRYVSLYSTVAEDLEMISSDSMMLSGATSGQIGARVLGYDYFNAGNRVMRSRCRNDAAIVACGVRGVLFAW